MAITPRRIPARFSRRPSRIARAVARSFSSEFQPQNTLMRKLRRFGTGMLKRLRALKVLAVAMILLAILASTTFLISSSSFRLSRIRVHREDLRTDVQEIQQALRPLFGRHLLLLSFAAIEHMVQETFPEVTMVDLGVDYPGTLMLTLHMDPIVMRVFVHDPEEREGEFLRAKTQSQGEEEVNTVLTGKGILLLYPFPMEEELPTLHLVDWGTRPVHRERMLSENDLSIIKSTQAALEWEFGHQVSSTVLYLRGREVHVATEGPRLWFDFTSPIEDQLQRYRVFLRSVPPEVAAEYVDLRLHDRVVYK